MNDGTHILYAAALAAGLQPVGVFALGAYRYIIIAPPRDPWQPPDIEGLRFVGTAPVMSYTMFGDDAYNTSEKGVVLWYIDSSMTYPDGE